MKGDPEVESLMVHRERAVAVCLNLYPYNPGHLMVFPRRHISDYGSLTDGEALALHRGARDCMRVLTRLYDPPGFNLGWNIGSHSGASIDHLHLHVVPRYQREVGFMDLIAQTRVVVEHPRKTLDKMRRAFRAL
jgi:ATP adenylyltransferase